MNWDSLGRKITVAAAVMILVTFAPPAVVDPIKRVFLQFRVNNVAATQADEDATSLTESVVKKARGLLR